MEADLQAYLSLTDTSYSQILDFTQYIKNVCECVCVWCLCVYVCVIDDTKDLP